MNCTTEKPAPDPKRQEFPDNGLDNPKDMLVVTTSVKGVLPLNSEIGAGSAEKYSELASHCNLM